ncbi:MAG: response regulator transcription factor [Massiliimalia sp.]|jgi:two-component system response regulator YesN
MYRVLLVDDEAIFLEYLTSMICWEEYDCMVCGTARSGEDALNQIKEYRPDIIFLDISMSRLSGLDVCEILKSWDISPQIIIMTAHNEFSFAHQAIKLDVFDYLLKPFDAEELADALTKCIADLKDKHRVKQLQQETVLQQLIRSGTVEPAAMSHLPFDVQGSFSTAVLRIRKNDNCDVQKLNQLVSCWFDKYHIHNFYIHDDSGRWIVVQYFLDRFSISYVAELWDRLLLSSDMGFLESVSLGKVVCEMSGLSESYQCAMTAYENRIKMGKRVTVYEEIQSFDGDQQFYSIQDVELLIRCFEAKNYQNANQIIDRIFQLSDGRFFSFQYVILVYHSLTISVYSHFHQEDGNRIEDYLKIQANIIQDLNDCVDTAQVKDVIQNYVYELFSDCMSISINSKKEVLVKKIEQYLQEHYGENSLSVDQIAEALYFENSYIRRVFKTVEGKTIMQRLEEIRIDKAKELLRQKSLRHAEIAQQCGFRDPYYFSKRFKLVCGCTPSEYQLY